MSFFSLFLALAFATEAPVIPDALKEIEAKYQAKKTVLAKFKQVTRVPSMKEPKTSAGVIAIRLPNQVRWETQTPDPNLLVSNGKLYWFYTPPFDDSDPGQVIVKKASSIQSELAGALLSGRFSHVKGMKILRSSPGEFLLIPKKGSAGSVKQTRVKIDSKLKLIQQVTLEHEDGNVSEVILSEIKLGQPLEDEMFNFKAPKGVVQVTQ